MSLNDHLPSSAIQLINMATRLLGLAATLVIVYLPQASSAGVFKCETPSGQIAYQSTPCDSSSSQRQLDIQAKKSEARELAGPSEKDVDDTTNEAPATGDEEGTDAPNWHGYQKQGTFNTFYYRVRETLDGPRLEIVNDYGSSTLSPTLARNVIKARKTQLRNASRCQENHQSDLRKRQQRKESDMKKALAQCKRQRNHYCDTRDPEKILELWYIRNNPTLDIPNDPVAAGMAISDFLYRKELGDQLAARNNCPSPGQVQGLQNDVELYEGALSAWKTYHEEH